MGTIRICMLYGILLYTSNIGKPIHTIIRGQIRAKLSSLHTMTLKQLTLCLKNISDGKNSLGRITNLIEQMDQKDCIKQLIFNKILCRLALSNELTIILIILLRLLQYDGLTSKIPSPFLQISISKMLILKNKSKIK